MENNPGSTPPSILQRARQNDHAAWDFLVKWAAGSVMKCCRDAGLQGADHDDVFQEVFLCAAARLGKFVRRTSFRAWIRRIAQRKIIDLFRSGKRNDKILARYVDENPLPGPDTPSGELSDANEVKDAIGLWLGEMKKIHQHETGFLPFHRLVADGCTVAEVAEEFGVTADAVRQYRCRWLRVYREEFEATFGEVLPPDSSKRPGWPR